MRRRRAAFGLLLVGLACRRTAPAGGEAAPSSGGVSPPARDIRVSAEAVSFEGRWSAATGATPTAASSIGVKVTCTRASRSCVEELATGGREGPSRQTFTYRISEWTKATLVATRSDGLRDVRIRVSLTGLAATKTAIPGGHKAEETRWRLE